MTRMENVYIDGEYIPEIEDLLTFVKRISHPNNSYGDMYFSGIIRLKHGSDNVMYKLDRSYPIELTCFSPQYKLNYKFERLALERLAEDTLMFMAYNGYYLSKENPGEKIGTDEFSYYSFHR